ncbi:hypothetical protein [Larkinella arboricola]|uniref:hypothetical protein n=1 Tax=Larkinella arboricola TaxID=643671 RepID=UPI000DBA8A46|nr:hypothetical protein [Larkinella arboricola]
MQRHFRLHIQKQLPGRAFSVGGFSAIRRFPDGQGGCWLYFPAQQSTIIVFLNKGVPTDKSLVDRVLFAP